MNEIRTGQFLNLDLLGGFEIIKKLAPSVCSVVAKISFTVYGSDSKFYQLTTSERSKGLTGFLFFRDLE